jgi:hypothetical protein
MFNHPILILAAVLAVLAATAVYRIVRVPALYDREFEDNDEESASQVEPFGVV